MDFRFEISEVENLSWQSFKSSTELELDFQDLRFLSLRNASLSSWVEELKLETSNLRDQWLRLWVWELELEFWKSEFKKVGFEIAVLQFEDWENWLWVLGFWVLGFQFLTFRLLVEELELWVWRIQTSDFGFEGFELKNLSLRTQSWGF